MTAFRLRLPSFSYSLSSLGNPLLILLFFFFSTSSFDLLHIPLLIFRLKLTNVLAFITFCYFFYLHSIQIPKQFLLVTLAILGNMLLSSWNTPNLFATTGLAVYFLFNFSFYFLLSFNQFRFFAPATILKVYSLSFYCVGIYAVCQVLFSVFGIILPGVHQYIVGVARGVGFCHEPSYYALYMTPYAIYCTTKYILQDPSERKIKDVLWPNVFLLASTSTGCFFTYLIFLFCLALFRWRRILYFVKLSIGKLLTKFTIAFSAVFGLLWIVNRNIITAGLLKFFYGEKLEHISVQDRWNKLFDYLDIFLDYPLTGVGIGAGPYYLAQKNLGRAIDLLDPAANQYYSPTNVTTEILAGLGIFGGVCFFYFICLLILAFRSALKVETLTREERITLIALGMSLCVMLVTLQFNQSIMRPYMWIHVGIFYGYATHLKRSV